MMKYREENTQLSYTIRYMSREVTYELVSMYIVRRIRTLYCTRIVCNYIIIITTISSSAELSASFRKFHFVIKHEADVHNTYKDFLQLQVIMKDQPINLMRTNKDIFIGFLHAENAKLG